MTNSFQSVLSKLNGCTVDVIVSNEYIDSTALVFEKRAVLRTDYWRMIKNGKIIVSSFDHKQQYGLPAPIDAIKALREELQSKRVVEVQWDKETADLLFKFTDEVKVQIFNFTGYEAWEISFPNGARTFSNLVHYWQEL